MRITVNVLHTDQWKHLKIAVYICQNLQYLKILLLFCKKLSWKRRHKHTRDTLKHKLTTRVYECVYREKVAFQCIHSHCRRLLVSTGERLQSLALFPLSFTSASCGGPPLFLSAAGPVSRRSLRWGITVMTSGGSLSASCEGCWRRCRGVGGL